VEENRSCMPTLMKVLSAIGCIYLFKWVSTWTFKTRRGDLKEVFEKKTASLKIEHYRLVTDDALQ